MIDETKLQTLVGSIIQDLGGAFSVPLVRIGEELGIYKALAEGGPLSSQGLADKTGLDERYLREWLSAQAASTYISYDGDTKRFSMTPEQAFVFANQEGPMYMPPAFATAAGFQGNRAVVQKAFQTGEGVAWGEQEGCLACAIARFFRPGYAHHLLQEWLPAMNGVVAKLQQGGSIADVGCGHGYATMILADAFPNATVRGVDFHEPSIATARGHAVEHGLTNLEYEVQSVESFRGQHDLITLFDFLHDLGDPAGAMRRIRESLRPGGAVMIVEPIAADDLAENLTPVNRLHYSASTMVCVPTSLAQDGRAALGAQAGEAQLREVVVEQGGFSTMRRIAETPFNYVFEAVA
ncbi:MAG: class I SAM-dependent methyltransferase [Myxococcota bacterium]